MPAVIAGQLGVGGQQLGQAFGLVVGEGVHRVEDERLDAGDALPFGAQHVVQDRVEERLGLSGAGAGGDQCGFRATGCPTGAFAAEPLEGLGLVAVGLEALVPVQAVAPARLGGFEGKPQPDVGALEEPLIRIREEVLDGGLRVPVRERERGGEVVGEPAAQVPGLGGGQKLRHQDFSSSMLEKCA